MAFFEPHPRGKYICTFQLHNVMHSITFNSLSTTFAEQCCCICFQFHHDFTDHHHTCLKELVGREGGGTLKLINDYCSYDLQ